MYNQRKKYFQKKSFARIIDFCVISKYGTCVRLAEPTYGVFRLLSFFLLPRSNSLFFFDHFLSSCNFPKTEILLFFSVSCEKILVSKKQKYNVSIRKKSRKKKYFSENEKMNRSSAFFILSCVHGLKECFVPFTPRKTLGWLAILQLIIISGCFGASGK